MRLRLAAHEVGSSSAPGELGGACSTTAMLCSPAATAKRSGSCSGSPGTLRGVLTSPGAWSASWRSSLLPQPHSSSQVVRKKVCSAPALTCTRAGSLLIKERYANIVVLSRCVCPGPEILKGLI
jgi:hypothetical protein